MTRLITTKRKETQYVAIASAPCRVAANNADVRFLDAAANLGRAGERRMVEYAGVNVAPWHHVEPLP